MLWWEQKTHTNDSDFCLTDVTGCSSKTLAKILCTHGSYVTNLVSHRTILPILVPTNTKSFDTPLSQNSEHSDLTSRGDILTSHQVLWFLKQHEVSYLVLDLWLAKDAPELLGSSLKETNLLHYETKFYWFEEKKKYLYSI